MKKAPELKEVRWYKTEKGKILKGYVVGADDAHTSYLLKVPHLHNKLVVVHWKDCWKAEDVSND